MLDLIIASSEYRTVEIDIDFVDFLVAKIFCGVIEEWFETLEKVPKSRITSYLMKNFNRINAAFAQSGRLGLAAFLAVYIWENNGGIGSFGKAGYAASLAIILRSAFSVSHSFIADFVARRLIMNRIPSILLITEVDEKAYKSYIDGLKSAHSIAFAMISVSLSSVTLNIISSYVYSWLTK